MSDLLLVAVCWLLYVYVGYPIALRLISLGRRVRPRLSESYEPSVSVLIAAYNEEKDISWKIAETLAWDYPVEKLNILVASDASSDATDEIVSSIDDRRVTFTRMNERGGKARALNRLAELARAEILFFTDANAHIGPQALRLMIRHFADERVGGVTGDSRPLAEIHNSALSSGASVYWGYESAVKQLESRIGSVLVCDGAIFACRAALFHRLDPNLANDLETPMRIGCAGAWITHEPGALVFEHETTSAWQEFQRRRRVCAQGMLAMLKLPGAVRGLRGWQFLSHKFLRWLSLIPMLMILAASLRLAPHSRFFLFLLGLQGVFYAFAAAGLVMTMGARKVPRLLAVPFYVVLGLVGALVGVVEALVGRRFDIWEIPSFSRGGAKVTLLGTSQE